MSQVNQIKFDNVQLNRAVEYIAANNPTGFTPEYIRTQIIDCAKRMVMSDQSYIGTMGFIVLYSDTGDNGDAYVDVMVDPRLGIYSDETLSIDLCP